MIRFDTAADMLPMIGREIGVSDWRVVSQSMIDDFARLTGDHQWIHVDVERCARERPDGRTIAHGLLIASLMPNLGIYEIARYSHGLNYGTDRVRYIGQVPSGSRIRNRLTLTDCVRIADGYRLFLHNHIEVEGQERGAMVADMIVQYHDPAPGPDPADTPA